MSGDPDGQNVSERNGNMKVKRAARDNSIAEGAVCEQTWKSKVKEEEGGRAVGHLGLLWGRKSEGETSVW